MAYTKLSLETLGDLDNGIANGIIQRELQRAIDDLDDRGDDDKPRKVKIEIELRRRADGNIETKVAANANLPARQTGTVAKLRKKSAKDNASLFFESWSPDNPDQRPLPAMDAEVND